MSGNFQSITFNKHCSLFQTVNNLIGWANRLPKNIYSAFYIIQLVIYRLGILWQKKLENHNNQADESSQSVEMMECLMESRSIYCTFDSWSASFCFIYAKNDVHKRPNKLTNGTRFRSGIKE